MEKDAKRVEPPDGNQSQNILRDLMLRDFGLLYHSCYKSNTHNLESAAEANLIVKKHKELKYELPGVPKATFLMAFSPDGTKMASAHGNHNVYISEVATGKNIKILSGHPRTPWCIAFHPSSNQIVASGCLGGQVRVWDLRNGCTVWNVASQTVIASLTFHPSGKSLVIATNNEIYFLDWRQPEPLAVISTKDDNEKVRYVAFDNSGRKLITGIGNIPERQESIRLSGLRRPHRARNMGVIHRNRVPNHCPERTTQNEPIQSFPTMGTEPSYSTQSNLLDSITAHCLESIARYTGNSGLRIGRASAEPDSRSNDDLVSLFFENVPAIGFNYCVPAVAFSAETSYRVQVWDFSKQEIPDVTNSEKNVVTRKCKIHNDASIDISSDGKLLATCAVGAVEIYSLEWETLGQRMYWIETMRDAVSVSISPTQEHLLVGLSRNLFDRNYTMASIYKLMNKAQSTDDEQDLYLYLKQEDKNKLYVRGSLQNNQLGNISINCIKWAPQPGQGLVYATNKGELIILH